MIIPDEILDRTVDISLVMDTPTETFNFLHNQFLDSSLVSL